MYSYKNWVVLSSHLGTSELYTFMEHVTNFEEVPTSIHFIYKTEC